MGAEVKASTDAPLALVAEAGKKFSNWAAYGDVWLQPVTKTFGVDAGIRLKSNLDLFAGAWSDVVGHVTAQAGMRFNF